ncbi:MAG: hypothetical protein ABEI97_00865 [Candidatus Nanohaloarchaea archaeon]
MRHRRTGTLPAQLKTVTILFIAVVVLAMIYAIFSGDVADGMSRGFSNVDASRIYTEINGLLGEGSAVTGLTLRNSYDTIQMTRRGWLVLKADFLENGQKEERLPPTFTYVPSQLSGNGVCIVKNGEQIALEEPPCQV